MDALFADRDKQADTCIRAYILTTGCAAIVPMAVDSLDDIYAIQYKMAEDLARVYGYTLSEAEARRLVKMIITGENEQTDWSKRLPAFSTIMDSVLHTYALGQALRVYYQTGMALTFRQISHIYRVWYREGANKTAPYEEIFNGIAMFGSPAPPAAIN